MRLKAVFHDAYFDLMGGAQTGLLSIIRGLDRSSIDPVLVTTGEGSLTELAREDRCEVIIDRPPHPLNIFGKYLLKAPLPEKISLLLRVILPYNIKFAKFLSKIKADILICNSHRSSAIFPFIRHLGRIPVIKFVRGTYFHGILGRMTFLSGSDYLIFESNDIVQLFNPRSKPYTVINPGINPDFGVGPFEKKNLKLKKQEGKRWMVSAANVVERKNFDLLLRSFSHISAKYPKWDLVIAGRTTMEPDYWSRMCRLAEELGIKERVYWLGWLGDIRPLLANADLFVLSSSEEGCPHCVLEAMCMALPVVTTEVAGVKELLGDDSDSLIVPINDVDSLTKGLSETIKRLEENPNYGDRNKIRVKNNFTEDKMCKALGTVIKSVVKKKIRDTD